MQPARTVCAERRDVSLQGLGGGTRRVLASEHGGEPVRRNYRSGVQPQHGEDGARLGARDRDRHAVLPDLQRSQNPQFHGWKRTHDDHRP